MSIRPIDDEDFYRLSKVDLVVAGVILFFSVFFFVRFIGERGDQSSQPKMAVIYQDHKIINKIKLEKTGTMPILDGRMVIESQKGGVRVLSSDCPHHICMNTGMIKQAGEVIVCVPNKVLIEIKSSGTPFLDAVSI